MPLTKKEAKDKALRNWSTWRLLLSDMSITYSDLDNMEPDDIAEANAALDIHLKTMKNANKE